VGVETERRRGRKRNKSYKHGIRIMNSGCIQTYLSVFAFPSSDSDNNSDEIEGKGKTWTPT